MIYGGIDYNYDYRNISKKIFNKIKTIPIEIKLNNLSEPIYNSQIYDLSDKNKLKDKFGKGSIGMVKVGVNKSSKTEFFFTLDSFPELDGRYSNFGIVISGYEILQNIDKDDLIKRIELAYWISKLYLLIFNISVFTPEDLLRAILPVLAISSIP